MAPLASSERPSLTALAIECRPRLVGRPLRAVAVVGVALLATVLTARGVAVTESYLAIQHSLPTYDGSTGPLFFTSGGVLVALAVLSGVLDAGLVPTVALAGGPVFGWAVNHFSTPITPHYAATFPLEMAVLYGGLFGVVGYLLGASVRRIAPQQRRVPVREPR